MSNLAKTRITELEAEIKTLTEANVAFEDQIKALKAERDEAVQNGIDAAAAKDQEIANLKAQVEQLSTEKQTMEDTLGERIKKEVATALAESGHDPVASGETTPTGEPKAKEPSQMTRHEAAQALDQKLFGGRK